MLSITFITRNYQSDILICTHFEKYPLFRQKKHLTIGRISVKKHRDLSYKTIVFKQQLDYDIIKDGIFSN